MANAKTLTNYFRVTDEKLFYEIIESMVSEDSVDVWCDNDGRFAFGCDGLISDETKNEESIHPLLQKILPEGEVIIVTEVDGAHSKYVYGHSVIITNRNIRSVDLNKIALEEANNLLELEKESLSKINQLCINF